LSLPGGTGIGLEGLTGATQGEAGIFEGLAQAPTAGSPAVPGVSSHLGEGTQHPAVQVEGVGHDEGGGEQHPHRRGVAPRGHVDDYAASGVAEHRCVDEVLAHAALVDGQVRPQASPVAEMGGIAFSAHGQAQAVLGHAQVTAHGPGCPTTGQVGEERQRPAARPSPVDAFEAFVEGTLVAVLPLAEKRRTHTDRVMTTVRTTSMTSRQPVPLVVPDGRAQFGHNATSCLLAT